MNKAIHRASPVYSQIMYIATRLDIRYVAIHRASPVISTLCDYAQGWPIIGTGLALYETLSHLH